MFLCRRSVFSTAGLCRADGFVRARPHHKSSCIFVPFPCAFLGKLTKVGDKFGESLGGSLAPLSFWEVPGLPRKFPKVPRKFFGDFPGSSLTVELNSNPEVPWKFPQTSPEVPQTSPEVPGLPRRSAPFSGKPDTLS